jgi:thymidylate synthase ThyX
MKRILFITIAGNEQTAHVDALICKQPQDSDVKARTSHGLKSQKRLLESMGGLVVNADSRMLVCDSVDTRIKVTVIGRTLLNNGTLQSNAVAQCQGCGSQCIGNNMKRWIKLHWPACIPRHKQGSPATV